MDARAKTIRDILYSRDQYLIPFFQREYSWKREHWERLWNDVLALVAAGSEAKHFMGPLVCTPFQLVPGEAQYQLIDGQQRLTTLTVLLVALRDVARERGEDRVEEEITEDFLVHKRQQGWARLKILPRTGDRDVLRSIIDGNLTKEFRRQRMRRAYAFFRKSIEAHLESVEGVRPELRRLLSALTGQLSLVVITITGENPYEIFESLNSTGLPLEESDLIRNYIFMQVPLEGQDRFNEQQWESFEELFEATDAHGALQATNFYRNYIMRTGTYSRRGSTFADFKALHPASDASPSEVVPQLAKFARYEQTLRYPALCEEAALRSALETLGQLDLTTAFPLAMALLDLRDRNEIDTDELVACLRDLASFALRRSICGESTRAYGQWFVGAAKGLGAHAREKLRSEWFRRGWPDDEAFVKALGSFALYRREHKKTRLLLDALEESSGHKEKVEPGTLSIEHVMPQTIGDDADGSAWKSMLGEDWRAAHLQLLHTLGNLTLTGYNSELSKRSFEKKRQILAESRLGLNEYFCEMETWDEASIRTRGEVLGYQACELWPRPAGGPAYEATRRASAADSSHALTDEQRRDYWEEFRLMAERESGDLPAMRRTRSGTGVRMSAGRSGVHFRCWARESDGRLAVEVVGMGRRGKPIVDAIRPRRKEIENAIGAELRWKGGRFEVERRGVDFVDVKAWEEHHQWLLDTLLTLIATVGPMVHAVEIESPEQDTAADDSAANAPTLDDDEAYDEEEAA